MKISRRDDQNWPQPLVEGGPSKEVKFEIIFSIYCRTYWLLNTACRPMDHFNWHSCVKSVKRKRKFRDFLNSDSLKIKQYAT